MTKTENYNLPQWEAGDPVRREDFNEAFANLDASLPYVVGSYLGNDTTKTITLGFKPRFLIISGDSRESNVSMRLSSLAQYFGFAGKDQSDSAVTLTNTGFSVTSDGYCPELNKSTRRYIYIAFR